MGGYIGLKKWLTTETLLLLLLGIDLRTGMMASWGIM
jgi:hypothetical protein